MIFQPNFLEKQKGNIKIRVPFFDINFFPFQIFYNS